MTSLNPSHNPFHEQDARHGQAIHDPSGSSSFPDNLPNEQSGSESDNSDLGGDDSKRAVRRGRKEGRQRIQRGMMPVPDLRFEQVSCQSTLSP